MKRRLGHLFQWKIFLPVSVCSLAVLIWCGYSVKKGADDILFISHASPEEIIMNKALIPKLNNRPQLIGNTLMYFIVKRKEQKLIDHFVAAGGDKGKTLIYLSQMKNYELFSKYYSQFQGQLSRDEYFLILRKTAQVNFTEGYRLLVNSTQFEDLQPSYREDISSLYQSNNDRLPASIQNK
jgi:hypothetical protein